jgi:hypothetical protein
MWSLIFSCIDACCALDAADGAVGGVSAESGEEGEDMVCQPAFHETKAMDMGVRCAGALMHRL